MEETVGKTIVAAVGTDGRRQVVWGLGVADGFDQAASEARNEAEHELCAQLCISEIRVVEIDAAAHERIKAGDVDAEEIELREPTDEQIELMRSLVDEDKRYEVEFDATAAIGAPCCGAVVHRHGSDLVCGLPAGHGGNEHNTAADGSGDAFPVRR